MSTLLLRLSGAMQSWGVSSRFGMRDTGLEPSKSGVIGLLCAAFGKPRTDEETETSEYPSLSRLANWLMGVRVDRAGLMLRDYQTIGGKHRRDEQNYRVMYADGSGKAPIESQRFYLSDACFLVGLEGRTAEDEAWLQKAYEKLRRPHWQLCLGRKAFVPGAPVWLPDGLTTQDLTVALRDYPPLCQVKDSPRFLIETAVDDYEAEVRRDVPLSFNERKFSTRYVKEVGL